MGRNPYHKESVETKLRALEREFDIIQTAMLEMRTEANINGLSKLLIKTNADIHEMQRRLAEHGDQA